MSMEWVIIVILSGIAIIFWAQGAWKLSIIDRLVNRQRADRADINQEKQSAKSIKSKLDVAESEIRILRENLHSARDDIRSAEEDNLVLKKQLEEKLIISHEQAEEIDLLRLEKFQLEEDNRQLANTAQQRQYQINDLYGIKEKLESDLQDIGRGKEKLEQEISELKEERKSLLEKVILNVQDMLNDPCPL